MTRTFHFSVYHIDFVDKLFVFAKNLFTLVCLLLFSMRKIATFIDSKRDSSKKTKNLLWKRIPKLMSPLSFFKSLTSEITNLPVAQQIIIGNFGMRKTGEKYWISHFLNFYLKNKSRDLITL